MLSRNGYLNNFLDRCFQQFLNRKYGVTQQRDAPAEPSPSPKYISLQLPHLGSISNNIRQELSSFIRHKAVVKVKLRCFQSTRKLQSWLSIKDGQALLNRFNVVYKLTCSCGAYIGQTQCNLINRIEENRTSLSSSVGRHFSSFVMSHESFWYAGCTQSYQKGKVWRPICFYSIYSSFLLQPMRKYLSILLRG